LQQIARDRIEERKSHDNAFALTDTITERLNQAVNLGPRERDFCFRYVLESKTVQQWAAYYSTSVSTIKGWLGRYEIRRTIEDIQYDIRKYMVGMSVNLLREAFNQQLRIMKMPEFPDGPILEVKRKTVMDIMAIAGVREDDAKEGKAKQTNILNFLNVQNGEVKKESTDMNIEATEEDMRQIEADVEELNQLATLHKAARAKKDEVKKISDNRGYSDEETMDLKVPDKL
jgi:hypothetical protein